MRNCFILALVLVLTLVFIQAQSPVTQEERLRKLEEICKQQDEQIQKLQSRLGVLQDEESYKRYTERIVKDYLTEPAAEETAGITAGYDNGFFIRSADGNLELKMTGYVQTGLGVFENNTFDNNSFYLSGVYTMFDLTLMKNWRAFIKVNFASMDYVNQFQDGESYSVSLADAFIEYTIAPELTIRAGNQLIPFSIVGQYSEVEGIAIWNEPFVFDWTHGLDVGITAHGVIANRIGYRFGIFNGQGSNTLNNTDDFMLAGQLRFYLCYDRNPNTFIHIGFLRDRDSQADSPYSVGLYTPWGRQLFAGSANEGSPNPDADLVQGWWNAADAGARIDIDFDNGSNLRLEGEFIYSTWQRNFSYSGDPDDRYSWMEGYAFWLGYSYRHCFRKDIPGSGLVSSFTFSWSDIDNEDSHKAGGNIRGQTVWTYTMGLGYAFNKHLMVNFNWVIVDADTRTYYGGTKKDDVVATGKAGGIEQAWFLQFSAMW